MSSALHSFNAASVADEFSTFAMSVGALEDSWLGASVKREAVGSSELGVVSTTGESVVVGIALLVKVGIDWAVH